MQLRAYDHPVQIITVTCVSSHWINNITGQQERAMQMPSLYLKGLGRSLSKGDGGGL